MENYFNTTQLKSTELKEAKMKATKQDEKILQQFKENPETSYFASTLWMNLFDVDNTPLTSIRRSINTLYNKGKIERLEEKADCPMYGKKVFQYKLKKYE